MLAADGSGPVAPAGMVSREWQAPWRVQHTDGRDRDEAVYHHVSPKPGHHRILRRLSMPLLPVALLLL